MREKTSASRYDSCPDCGGPKIKGCKRCHPCHLISVRKPMPSCADCGKTLSYRGRERCKPCASARRRGRPSPKPPGFGETIARARWDGRRATTENLPERFWALVDKTSECWLWTGGRGGKDNAYGKFGGTSAHRIAYAITHGSVDPGLDVDHLCCTPLCVRPTHLEAVTPEENRRRQSARVTHCKHGHPLSGQNLYLDKRGFRSCRTCRNGRR